MKKLVVIGNGMAPGRVLEELYQNHKHDYQVTIFNAEPRVNYDRIMLSPVLSGEKNFEEIVIHNEQWYAERDITLYKAKPVDAIDRGEKFVQSVDGTRASYDKLIIATGSRPFIPPIAGCNLDGVYTYRDYDDVNAMLRAAATGAKAVVIGGGLLGLEAAAGLKERGMEVTVLHLASTLMERQLDKTAGILLEQALCDRGIRVITEANTEAIIGENEVSSVALSDGSRLDADIVVIAVGIKPNIELAEKCGLAVNRGVVVNDNMQTSDPDVYAVGECVEHRNVCYGLVAPLYEMASVLAKNLGVKPAAYIGSRVSTKLKVTGIDVFSAGDFADGENRETIVFRDTARNIYKRLIIEHNRIIGIVLVGETKDGAWLFQQLKDEIDIGDRRDAIIFGSNYDRSNPVDPTVAVAALPDDAYIRGCNGTNQSKPRPKLIAKALSTPGTSMTHRIVPLESCHVS